MYDSYDFLGKTPHDCLLACLLVLLLSCLRCCRIHHCAAKAQADCLLGGGSLELRHALRNFPRRDTTQAASSCVSVPRHTTQTYKVKVMYTDRLGCREPPASRALPKVVQGVRGRLARAKCPDMTLTMKSFSPIASWMYPKSLREGHFTNFDHASLALLSHPW